MEAHSQLKNGNVMRFVRNYWFLIVFLFGAAFAWSEMRAQVESNRVTNDKQETRLDQNASKIDSASIQTAVAEEKLKNIEFKIDVLIKNIKQ